MTEAGWLASADTDQMLEFLRGKTSERKLQLFVCACCRLIWDLLDDPARQNVEVGERFVDGLASVAERHDACAALLAASGAIRIPGTTNFTIDWAPPTLLAAAIACSDGTESLASSLTGRLETGLGTGGDGTYRALAMREYLVRTQWQAKADNRQRLRGLSSRVRRSFHAVAERLLPDNTGVALAETVGRQQSGMLRDIFGNPFQSVTQPEWRTATTNALAEAIYTERAFDRLPILADALEDAGCTDAAILDHCRQPGAPGAHVRGCWVVDLVLAKE